MTSTGGSHRTPPGRLRVLRRSHGRLRLALPAPAADPSRLEHAVQAAPGVQTAMLSLRTGNLLVTYDPQRTGERLVLEVIARALAAPPPSVLDLPAAARSAAPPDGLAVADLDVDGGWLAAEGACLVRAAPSRCARAILDFAAYPEWQRYVTATEVLEHDRRGRGAVVRTEGQVGEQRIVHVMRYRYPSPTRIAWEQLEGELEDLRGEWRFVGAGRAATRASFRLEIRPGLRLRLLLRGPLYGQARDALFAHTLAELHARVEGADDRAEP